MCLSFQTRIIVVQDFVKSVVNHKFILDIFSIFVNNVLYGCLILCQNRRIESFSKHFRSSKHMQRPRFDYHAKHVNKL